MSELKNPKYFGDVSTLRINTPRINIKTIQEEKKPTPLEILKELVEFIENEHLTDELCDDGGGYTDTWRSEEFDRLTNQVKEVIKKELEHKQLINEYEKTL